jgi:hypothetical protein
MASTNLPRLSEKGEPYRLSPDAARRLEEHLRFAKAGHFPIYDGERIVGVLVSTDRFNVLVHLAELLDDPRIAAAVAAARARAEEKESHLSFEEVFGS